MGQGQKRDNSHCCQPLAPAHTGVLGHCPLHRWSFLPLFPPVPQWRPWGTCTSQVAFLCLVTDPTRFTIASSLPQLGFQKLPHRPWRGSTSLMGISHFPRKSRLTKRGDRMFPGLAVLCS